MAGASPDPSPESSFQALWDENYDLIRSYLKRLSYLRTDHISAKEFSDSTLSCVYQNFMRRVHGFDGRNWEVWLYKLVRSTARDEVRSIIGRFKGTRTFVPLDELDHEPFIAGHAARREHDKIIHQVDRRYRRAVTHSAWHAPRRTVPAKSKCATCSVRSSQQQRCRCGMCSRALCGK